ncbi:hydrogenase accessory protein [Prosthecomicrobium hirschii]|uniref:Hydrogenase expression/formation protein n=1 Tax=Prosthecodimorpha hirschii TaxID=665126 RepID=A0A0N8GF04_9HYPH|nr:hydrogenase accessory protein [Prosthecomicrobium hirschii]KPL52969.1 hydrogenase accessory protein [Prosthecomicrobium hirschii]TPQ52959.1 hydrogenase accessory protein [Prosthecomicrobium hirschii]
MPPLIAALATRHGIPTVDVASVDAFLAPAAGEPPHALLFFTGDPEARGEAVDVAVILPELIAAFPGRLRAARVERAAETALMARFNVRLLPSLALVRGGEPLAVMPRVMDWVDYLAAIDPKLSPDAPVMAAPSGPRVEITHSSRRSPA